MRVSHDSDITLFSRYECKYLVDRAVIPQLRAFVRPFMNPDRYAALHAGNRYSICSLYLDSDDLALYRQTVGGEKNRFKLRARTYSDGPDAPVFLEIKGKRNNVVQKRRARVSREVARSVILRRPVRRPPDETTTDEQQRDVERFAGHMTLVEAKPVVRVRYQREAYESAAGDPVRITVDTDLCHAVTFDDTLSHADGPWVPTPVDGAIVEIKFTERFPSWVADLVRALGLTQQPVPKYVMCVEWFLNGDRRAPLAIAGFMLPARRG